MRRRLVDSVADGTVAGAGIAFLFNLADWVARHGWGNVDVLEVPRLKIMGSAPWVVVRIAGEFLLRWTGPATVVLVLILMRWSATRRPTTIVTAVAAAVAAAWVALLSSCLTYSVDPTWGLLSPVVASIPATVLAAWCWWPTTATVVLASGIGGGALAAQGAFAFQSSAGYVIQPFSIFAVAVVATAAAVGGVLRFGSAAASPYVVRFLRALGLCALSVSAVATLAAETRFLRVQESRPAGSRFLAEKAYDVRITGEPPALVWTNRQHIEMIDDVYGTASLRRSLEGTDLRAERLWPEAHGGFYAQLEPDTGWWQPTVNGEPIPEKPAAWLHPPEWGDGVPSNIAFAEDALRGRFLTFSEFDSQYAVVDRATNAIVVRGRLPGFWPWWHVTGDQAARLWFASGATEGGWLYVFDFDAMAVVRKQSGLYFHETVVDSKNNLLWGARPLTGELMAVDIATLAIRHRVKVEPTVRDVQIDEATGDLFTCSFLSGSVYRVNRRSLAAKEIGWCGRLCRNLFFDAPRQTLWVATADAVCRIPSTTMR